MAYAGNAAAGWDIMAEVTAPIILDAGQPVAAGKYATTIRFSMQYQGLVTALPGSRRCNPGDAKERRGIRERQGGRPVDRLTVFGERGNAPASHTQAETRASLWRREGAAAESTQKRPGLFLAH